MSDRPPFNPEQAEEDLSSPSGFARADTHVLVLAEHLRGALDALAEAQKWERLYELELAHTMDAEGELFSANVKLAEAQQELATQEGYSGIAHDLETCKRRLAAEVSVNRRLNCELAEAQQRERAAFEAGTRYTGVYSKDEEYDEWRSASASEVRS